MSERTAKGTRLRWRDRVLLAIAGLAIRLLGMTWRVRQDGFSVVTERRGAGLATVYAFWHGQMLPLLFYHRDEGVTLLISSSRDGELISLAANAFGYPTIRGSSSRDASGALRAIVRTLRAGTEVAVTPDGPRGPLHEFAPGGAVGAFEAGVPVVLIATAARRAWRLKSWDRFMIPKPFTRVVIAYQAAEMSGTSAREIAASATSLGEQLLTLCARADALALGLAP